MHQLEHTLCEISALIKAIDGKKSYDHLDAIADALLCVASMSHYEYAPTHDTTDGFSAEDVAVAKFVDNLRATILDKG